MNAFKNLSAMPVLVILMKVMSTPFSAEYNQEVTLPSSRLLFGKLTWGRMDFHTMVSLYGTI